jgi:hypothetical protein
VRLLVVLVVVCGTTVARAECEREQRELATYRAGLPQEPSQADINTLRIYETQLRTCLEAPARRVEEQRRSDEAVKAEGDAQLKRAIELQEQRKAEQGEARPSRTLEMAQPAERRVVLSALLCDQQQTLRGSGILSKRAGVAMRYGLQASANASVGRTRFEIAATKAKLRKYGLSATSCSSKKVAAVLRCVAGDNDSCDQDLDDLYSSASAEIENETYEKFMKTLRD